MATFHNIDHLHQHTNTYVVWGSEFDSAAARLGVSLDTLAAMTDPLAVELVDDPLRYPTEPGTSYRAAPLRMPNGTRLRLRYRVDRDARGETRCVLDHVVVPTWVPAT
jgi:hypothetical protein